MFFFVIIMELLVLVIDVVGKFMVVDVWMDEIVIVVVLFGLIGVVVNLVVNVFEDGVKV